MCWIIYIWGRRRFCRRCSNHELNRRRTTRMSIEICILASGSGGNCTVVRTPSGVLLIDAGLGPLSAARRMEGSGGYVREISAGCLTHLDHDHFSPSWVRTLIRLQIPVVY